MEKGSRLENFLLLDQNETETKLEDLRGRKVLLSFHPLAWTSVCASQMKALEEHKERFAAQNAVALGISVDPVPAKNAWAEKLGIKDTRLLSDFWPHGEVAKKLGVFREENGFSERANFILNEDGKIIFKKIYPIPELPDMDELLQVLGE